MGLGRRSERVVIASQRMSRLPTAVPIPARARTACSIWSSARSLWAGSLSEEQRARLRDIADRCPVHRTLISEMKIW